MNLCETLILPVVHHVNHPWMSLMALPYLKRSLGKNVEGINRLVRSPIWEARWVATQKVVEVLPAQEAWTHLCQLAQDSVRYVREGAAYGLGFLLSREPVLQDQYAQTLSLTDIPAHVRRAVLHSTVVLWRQYPPQLEVAASLLTVAARQSPKGCYRTIGSQLVARELMKVHPQAARQLLESWATSDHQHLQYHASLARMRLEASWEKNDMPIMSVEASSPALLQQSTPYPEKIKIHWTDTSQLTVPSSLLDQVIGQDQAVKMIRLAARQRRYLLLIGQPGTGKSMLARAMSEYVSSDLLKDVLAMPRPYSSVNPRITILPAGTGMKKVEEMGVAREDAKRAMEFVWGILWIGILVAGSVLSILYHEWIYPVMTGLTLLALGLLKRRVIPYDGGSVPHVLVHQLADHRRCFIDATGFQSGALLGDVRHDPFQSGGRETPSHQLLEAGAIHWAHGGVLFMDEISTLSMESQQQLLTAIQEKQFPIVGRSAGSSGSMVHSDPVPCDFILVMAGTEADVEKLHPALRSRIRGFGYEIRMKSEMIDNPQHRYQLAQFVAQEVVKDGKIPHFTRGAVEAVIDYAGYMSGKTGHLSLRLRELGGIVRAAGDMAVLENASLVTRSHVQDALQIKSL
jgi:MoxR-like ATPase